MTLPITIWIPAGALVISTGAFAVCMFLAWDRADVDEGEKWNAAWGWWAERALVAVFVCVFLTALGGWWTMGPFG